MCNCVGHWTDPDCPKHGHGTIAGSGSDRREDPERLIADLDFIYEDSVELWDIYREGK